MHKISLLALCEPMVGRDHLDIVRRKLGFPYAFSNDEGRICVFTILIIGVLFLPHQINSWRLQITHTLFHYSFLVVFVHASCDFDDR